MKSLEEIATYIVSDGKGILAADESTPTIGKRFATINAESTEDSRRDYREMLFRADGMKNNIGGVILFDETLRQDAKDGTPLKDIISEQQIKKKHSVRICFPSQVWTGSDRTNSGPFSKVKLARFGSQASMLHGFRNDSASFCL